MTSHQAGRYHAVNGVKSNLSISAGEKSRSASRNKIERTRISPRFDTVTKKI